MPIGVPIATDALDELCGVDLLDEPQGSLPLHAGYRLDRVIGRGSFAVTFRATALADGRASDVVSHPPAGARAVIKVFRPDMLEANGPTLSLMLRKEVEALSRISARTPPVNAVVRLYAAGTLPIVWIADRGLRREVISLPWLALEWVDGGPRGTTLENRIEYELRATGNALAPNRIARLTRDLLRGLAALHELGVTHRDIKPENLLLCGEPPVELLKLSDLGIAAVKGLGMTFEQAVGSVGYMAPEQGDRSKLEGPHTDVFAVGAVLFEMFTGTMLFPNGPADLISPKRRSLLDAARRHDSLQVTSLEPLLEAFDEVIAAATSTVLPDGRSIFRNPPREHAPRIATIQALQAELLPLLAELEMVSGTTTRRPRLVLPPVHRARFTLVDHHADVRPNAVLDRVVISPDGTATGSAGGELWYFDAREWRRAPSPARALGGVTHVGGRHGGRFAFRGLDGSVMVLSDNEWVRLPLPGQVGNVTAFAGRPDGGACLAAMAPDGLPYLAWFDRGAFAGSQALPPSVQAETIVRVGERFVAAGSIETPRGRRGWIGVVGGKKAAEEGALDCPPLRALDASADNVVVGVGDGGTVIAWTVGSELVLRTGLCDAAALSSVVFDGYGAIWATGGKNIYCIETLAGSRIVHAAAGSLPEEPIGLGVVTDAAVAALRDGRFVFATMTVEPP
jgi:serine/threonine protein kinase